MLSTAQPPVLIVGAGPTGMVLALWLQKFSTPFRIIDRLPGPGLTSRALIVHARTLEFYRQLGIAERIISAGLKINSMVLAFEGVVRSSVSITGGPETEKLSRYPFSLSLPQDIHESILAEVLKERGIDIERQVDLAELFQDTDKGLVEAKLHHLETETDSCFTASYVAGCDGAHSLVRQKAGIAMSGGTYSGRFFVSDVDIVPGSTPAGPQDMNMNMSKSEYCMIIPTQDPHSSRLLGVVPRDKENDKHLSFASVQNTVKSCLPNLQVRSVGWFSAYKVHHRAAEHFRSGRLFLCGDSGGQGMNTGIGDATNLAWKLSSVHSGRAKAELLDTYEPERLAFAHSLVNTTDRGFSMLMDEGWLGWLARGVVVPYVVPALMKLSRITPFEATSQIRLQYRDSACGLSVDAAGYQGRLRAGDRLGYVVFQDRSDNFEVLAEGSWQVHVYGEVLRDVRREMQAKGLGVKKFEFTEDAKRRGLSEGSLYLIRPDGYVAVTANSDNTESLFEYMARWGFDARPGAQDESK